MIRNAAGLDLMGSCHADSPLMAYRLGLGAVHPNVLMMAGHRARRLPTTRPVHAPGFGRAWGVQVRDLNDKIRLIREQIYRSERDPAMHALTLGITRACPDSGGPTADACEANAIFWFFNDRRNLRYRHDHVALDSFRTCSRTLQFGSGDCDDAIICLCTALRIVGHNPKMRVIKTGGDWSHIYVVLPLPKLAARPTQWVALDTTLQGSFPGKEVPRSQVEAVKDFEV